MERDDGFAEHYNSFQTPPTVFFCKKVFFPNFFLIHRFDHYILKLILDLVAAEYHDLFHHRSSQNLICWSSVLISGQKKLPLLWKYWYKYCIGRNGCMLFPFNFRLIEERGKSNQRNCGEHTMTSEIVSEHTVMSFANDKHQQKLKWVELWICRLQLISWIVMRLSSRQVWRTLFKFGGKSTKPIEDWIVHFLIWFWCKGDLGRIWPQISYSIRQELFWCGILKS